MPSIVCQSDGEIALLVRFGFPMGCIVSPYLFNVYMDDLSCLLNCCNTGCVSGGSIINHLMCADDLGFISPSATGMK